MNAERARYDEEKPLIAKDDDENGDDGKEFGEASCSCVCNVCSDVRCVQRVV